jgi:hypothetical protein
MQNYLQNNGQGLLTNKEKIMTDKNLQLITQAQLDLISRFEVIEENGRAYVKYLNNSEELYPQLQDDGRTLKIFLRKVS